MALRVSVALSVRVIESEFVDDREASTDELSLLQEAEGELEKDFDLSGVFESVKDFHVRVIVDDTVCVSVSVRNLLKDRVGVRLRSTERA